MAPNIPDTSIHGDTVLVLGGTSGIGLAAAQALLAKDVSAILVGKSEKKIAEARTLMKKYEKKVAFWAADLSCKKSWSSVITKINELDKRIRIKYLVNSAGVFVPKAFLEHDHDDYRVSVPSLPTAHHSSPFMKISKSDSIFL